MADSVTQKTIKYANGVGISSLEQITLLLLLDRSNTMSGLQKIAAVMKPIPC